MTWKQHLTAGEAERLAYLDQGIKAQALLASAERRRIYDRCRKRMARQANPQEPQ